MLPSSGELLSPGSLDVMDELAVGEEAGASSSSVGADSDDSLPQPAPIPLVESIDEALVPDIIAGTTGTPSVFQSAWVALSILQTSHITTTCYFHDSHIEYLGGKMVQCFIAVGLLVLCIVCFMLVFCLLQTVQAFRFKAIMGNYSFGIQMSSCLMEHYMCVKRPYYAHFWVHA